MNDSCMFQEFNVVDNEMYVRFVCLYPVFLSNDISLNWSVLRNIIKLQ